MIWYLVVALISFAGGIWIGHNPAEAQLEVKSLWGRLVAKIKGIQPHE